MLIIKHQKPVLFHGCRGCVTVLWVLCGGLSVSLCPLWTAFRNEALGLWIFNSLGCDRQKNSDRSCSVMHQSWNTRALRLLSWVGGMGTAPDQSYPAITNTTAPVQSLSGSPAVILPLLPSRRTSEIKLKITLSATRDDEGGGMAGPRFPCCRVVLNFNNTNQKTSPDCTSPVSMLYRRRKLTS